MKIREMPFFTRPGYKLKQNGVGSLDDGELLSIILGFGSREESALELAHRLLQKYNLNGLGNCSLTELTKDCGNEVKALKLLCLIELSKRYNRLKDKGYSKVINSAEAVFNMLWV